MKKIMIIVITIFSFFVICLGALYFYYNSSLKAVGSDTEKVTLVVENGMTTRSIVDSIYNAGLIKNKYCGYVFIKINKDYNLQAGVYDLHKGMSFKEILDYIAAGKVRDDSISITFVEGKRIPYYVSEISKVFGYNEDEVMDVISDTDYLNQLIDKYWFLSDEILNKDIYYPLEGYLYPNTYQFNKDAKVEDIIEKLLYTTGVVLNEHKELIDSSKYSVHELLTMASIVELEGANSDDRFGVAGVFFNRLENGWSLGSDVTTYYAAKIDFGDRDLYQVEIDEVNAYNTRPAAMAGKLPVGPICGPSSMAIEATLKPSKHDYFYFVADKYKKTYFTKTYSEHTAIINKLKNEGLWYVYK